MQTQKKWTTEQLKAQIEAYREEKENHYDQYTRTLKRVLEKACAVHLPEAVVQVRAKSVDSFAEKCVRKGDKYKDPVHDMTDLCGGRVIVQTLDQVAAVRTFIKANFRIIEEDEKGSGFADTEFGYRDVHYIVELLPERCPILGLSDEEQRVIGARRAEIQVRTWMQHAWADTLHDRMYKTTLKYPREFRRLAGLLAALMEDGDRTFNMLARDIDGMLANYQAYASKTHITAEAERQEQILANVDESKRPRAAMQLARLLSAQGHYGKTIDVLRDYAQATGALRPEILLDLGYATCRQHRSAPSGPDYQRGLAWLEESVALLEAADASVPLNMRKHNSLLARALARKAWALTSIPGRIPEARTCYQTALEREPGNPYHLTEVIGHEIECQRQSGIVNAMRAPMREALENCREHMENGTEIPYACFAAGRLHLLLGDDFAALNNYARGIAYFLADDFCFAPDILDTEEKWIRRVVGPEVPKGGFDWALRLFELARRVKNKQLGTSPAGVELTRPVLILAGGAVSLNQSEARSRITARLKRVFAGLTGTVISGGTDCGVPGCAGEAAAGLGAERTFTLVGFRPRLLPDDAPADRRYDRQIISGEDHFTPAQVIHCWEKLLNDGVAPSEVRLLGIGGGPIAAFEYRLALALGALVGVVESSGGTADVLLQDLVWAALPNLLPLPDDPDTLRAFAHPAAALPFSDDVLDEMAKAFHANYVAGNQNKLPPNMRPWPKLDETYRIANREQARYVVKILESCGFQVRPAADAANPKVFSDFTPEDIERLAEMEHGRWNVERLRQGWRRGDRDDSKKRHNCLVPWLNEAVLTDEIKGYDRQAVKLFPGLLAKVGLEVTRKAP